MTPGHGRCALTVACALLLAVMVACTGKDQIDLKTQPGTTTATVLVDGRRAECVNDEKIEGLGVLEIDNLLSAGNCPSQEVVAFAKNNAVTVRDTTKSWSDPSGDVVRVDMSAPPTLPVAVFVMFGDPGDTAARAQEELNVATELYEREQCGIVFTKELFKDVRRGDFPAKLLTAGCKGHVPDFDKIDPAVTAAKGVKVFYSELDSDLPGETCPDRDSAIIVIANSYRDTATLAHELGHALSLDHANCVGGMPLDNIMMSPASWPASMTIGQCFRTSLNCDSVLNKLHFRAGAPPRSCPDLKVSADCPSITLQK